MNAQPSKNANVRLALYLLAAVIGVILIAGCSTTFPKIRNNQTVSFSGNERDAGIVASIHGGGFVVKQAYVTEYNGLVAVYGAGSRGRPYTPALKADDGIARYQWQPAAYYLFGISSAHWIKGSDVEVSKYPSVLYAIDNEHARYFVDMNQWRNNGIQPYASSSKK